MSRFRRLVTAYGFGTLMAFLLAPSASAQVIASDNFNRADEAPFSITGNWGRVIAGNYDGVSHLVNNHVTGVSNEGIYYWTGAGTFDPTRQFARQKVVSNAGEIGLVLLGGTDQAIMVAWGPPGLNNTVYIYWYSEGQDRGQLTTGPSSLSNGDIIEAVLDGGVIYAKVNGVTVKSVANTTTLTSGVPGFITYLNPGLPAQVGMLDDWEAGTPASYSISGTVTEDAAGLSGVLVTASGGFAGSATTNGNGDYTIPGVPGSAVSVVLTPTLAGHTMTPTTRTVPGPLAADVTGQDFTSEAITGATLTINATHGTVIKNPDQPSYTIGTVVTLTPAPNAGYSFASWSGDVPVGDETDNPLQVTMNQNRVITANFLADGLVAADDFNRANETPLAVGGNWQQSLGGSFVNLSGNQVAGASGDAVYFWNGPGTFSNTRQFARATVVQPSGQVGMVLLGGPGQAFVVAWGSGRIFFYWYSGGGYQSELANVASPLQAGDEIEAVLDQGRIFAKRNGVVVHSVANTTSLTSGKPGFETYLSGAIFDNWEAGTPPTFSISGTITENAAGLSGATVTASGSFTGSTTTDANGAFTLSSVPFGATTVVLTPTLSGHAMTPPSRTVVGPLTANVTGQDFTSSLSSGFVLTVNATHGSVIKNPDLPIYDSGTVVTLTPVPSGGYGFVGWSGDVPLGDELDNPLQVTMSQDRTITANFLAEGVLAADDFNRANEVPLTVGGNWLQPFGGGSANLTGQQVAGASNEAVYYWNGPGSFSSTRQFARATVVDAGGQVGMVLLGSAGRAIVVGWSGGNLFVYWYLNNSNQGQLANIASPLQDGDEIEAVLDQGRIYAKRNGVVVLTVQNTTSLTSGAPGFETFLTGAIIDDWSGGTPPTQTISGTITENAVGVSGVTVTASGGFSGSTTTNGSGAYALSGVPFGVSSVVVTPSLAGYVMTPLSRTVNGPLTGDVAGQDFTAAPTSGAILTINAVHGTVTRNPDLASYPFGSDVTLTPVPDPGYRFVTWSGDVPPGDEVDNPLVLTMDQHKTISAVFVSNDALAWDTFNRPNETPVGVGGNWVKPIGGGFSNLTNQQIVGNGANDSLYNWQGAGSFNGTRQFARSTVTQAGGQVGLVLLGSPGQAIVVAWNAGTLYIYWYTSGIIQGNLTTASSTVQNGDRIEALLDNGIVYAKKNGTVVTSVANTTSIVSGRPGFETFQSGGAFDDWEAGPTPNDCSGQPDGTPCVDGDNACTTGDTCQAGVCVGTPVICDDGNTCTVDSCTPGVGCQSVPGNAGAVCRVSAGQCDVAETCTGSSSTCPADAFASSATVCTGGSEGGACDLTDHCSGTSNTCVDGFQTGSFTCRPAIDGCDVAETCTGSSGTCPADNQSPLLGAACDGADSDLCAEGVNICVAGAIACDDTSGDNLDICNGANDDCDPASADGSEDPGAGVACDGADGDLCNEGITVCTAGALACNDTTGDNLDVCNGADDDCDPASADGAEDPAVGVACDGTDSDLCNEGIATCTAGSIVCSDITGSTVDLCNGVDDDCDPASADGAEDAGVGIACDGPDSDLCAEGITTCASGAIACGDATGDNIETCNGLDDDCDGATDENGAALCNDGNACTIDACSGGTCAYAASGTCGVGGTVLYYRDFTGDGSEPSVKPVANVGLDWTQDAVADATTAASGTYTSSGLFGNVLLTTVAKLGSPRASDHNGAITGTDAAQIARSAVGLVTLSANQRIAGDVTGDGTISALDASQVARFATLLVNHFDVATATGSDWKFVRCDAYAFPGDPGCGTPSYNFTPISQAESGKNFYAILYGDVTGNWAPAAPLTATADEEGEGLADDPAVPRAAATRLVTGSEGFGTEVVRDPLAPAAVISIDALTLPLRPGERRQLAIRIAGADGILGLDLSLKYDRSRLAIVGVEPAGIAMGWGVAHLAQAGTHRISAYGVSPLAGDGAVLNVTVEARAGTGRDTQLELSAAANEGAIPLRVQQRNKAPRRQR
jgi:hypothetical protein